MTNESTAVAITVEGLTKRYGELVAVDDLSFSVRPGSVTGFLGPNGAGKTTALKAIVGIARPTAGRTLIHGTPVDSAHADARVLGVYIETTGAHPGRSARNHLRSLAALARLPRGRVDEVLGIVGLEDVAGRRVGTFSTGMRQRLGIASALLGDPAILVMASQQGPVERLLRPEVAIEQLLVTPAAAATSSRRVAAYPCSAKSAAAASSMTRRCSLLGSLLRGSLAIS